jgi:TetR/AcrR family transcriptional regulator, transcriptional repressor of bet genes
MPRIIDHDARRDEIAHAACRAAARHGFDRLTLTRIASEAGCTTGMLAHYFESKHDIILAALRLISERIKARLSERLADEGADLLEIFAEALPLDAQRMLECAVWVGFWGQVRSDGRIRAINDVVHAEWNALIRRCVEASWPEAKGWPEDRLRGVCRAIQLFINGISASAVTSPDDWSAEEQVAQLAAHLQRLRRPA